MASPVGFVKSVYGELKHVSWPTRAQTIRATILVIVLSAIAAVILGVFDFFFTKGTTAVVSDTQVPAITQTADGILLEGDGGVTVTEEDVTTPETE